MLTFGVVVLGVTDAERAEEFWRSALGYQVREDGFGGWAKVLTPPGGRGTMIALQTSTTPPQEHPRLHFDLHVASAAEQQAEADRLISLGASRADWDSYPDDPDFIVLADPDGNLFCIVDLGHERAEPEHAEPESAEPEPEPQHAEP
jgi:catechol 2,3-dioxygenase-like lactoylglutathione lyase family enzyme